MTLFNKSEAELEAVFQQRIDSEQKIEPKDWMPEAVLPHSC